MGSFILKSLNDINTAAAFVIDEIDKYKVTTIALFGEMGAGKTTLIKRICELLGSEDVVTSPTFSLINEYITQKGLIYHFDFYRVMKESEIFDIGAYDYFYSNQLCFVEWPEKAINALPEIYLKIEIEVLPNEERKLNVNLNR